MPASKTTTKQAGISSTSVQAKTGKTWAQWLALLDKMNAKSLPHKEIAVFLHTRYGLSPWWSQMVTVGYEQARGLREKHQTPRGYEANISKTFPVSAEVLYSHWNDSKKRKRWITERFKLSKAIPNTSLRLIWGDSSTKVSVDFNRKGETKTQLVIQHHKLPDEKAVQKMKKFWKESLERLSGVV